MEWKQIVTSAITGVLVTVLSGIAVWYLTYEGTKSEGVVYEISNTGQFGSGPNRLTFANVSIKNLGTAKSDQIYIDITERNGSEISETQIGKSSPLLDVAILKSEKKSLRLSIKKLLPGESVNASLLFRGPSKVYLGISGRTNEKIVTRLEKKKESKSNRNFLFVFFVIFAFFSINARGLSKYIFGRYIRSYPPSRNNSGFLLLHGGFAEDSVYILDFAIKNGECSPLELSNLALAREIHGETDSATNLIEIANKWSSTRKEISVTLFNHAAIEALRGDIDSASEKLRLSIETDPEIKEYCKNSAIFSKLFKDHEVLYETFNNSKFKKSSFLRKLLS